MTPKPLGTFSFYLSRRKWKHPTDNQTYSFYTGKRAAYVYRANKEIRGTKLRVIWGTIVNVHGMFFLYPLCCVFSIMVITSDVCCF